MIPTNHFRWPRRLVIFQSYQETGEPPCCSRLLSWLTGWPNFEPHPHGGKKTVKPSTRKVDFTFTCNQESKPPQVIIGKGQVKLWLSCTQALQSFCCLFCFLGLPNSCLVEIHHLRYLSNFSQWVFSMFFMFWFQDLSGCASVPVSFNQASCSRGHHEFRARKRLHPSTRRWPGWPANATEDFTAKTSDAKVPGDP